MARASTRTLLPLDEFFRIVGHHPLLANQVTVEDVTPHSMPCYEPLLQWSWQDAQKMGREEIAEAIASAEERLASYLKFKPAPSWEVAEIGGYPRPATPELSSITGLDIRGYWGRVSTEFGHVIAGGKETKTLIDDNVTIVYSDPDSDNYDERATITVSVPSTVTNPDEIAIYYPGTDADDAWEIRPITVTIASGVATIICQRAQLVDPDLLEKMVPVPVDGMVDANFLTTVDVYRHWNDPQSQVEFIWNEPCDSPLGAGSFGVQTGVLTVQNARLGLVALQPATWNTTTGIFDASYWQPCRAPDMVRLWYFAGWRHKGSLTRMDPLWARVVTRYALTFLERPFCACEPLRAFVMHWKEDLALRKAAQSQATSYALSQRILGNPLGTQRGAIYAWEHVLKYYNAETIYGPN